MTEHTPLTTVQQRVRLRAEDYLLLDANGALDNYGKTELLDGDIFPVNAQHRPHARIKSKLYIELIDELRAMGSDLFALIEASIALSSGSVPEPDILLTNEPDGDGLVPLSSLALVVEVSDSTLDFDLGRKTAIYAEASVPEYWVADVQGRVIHQHWQPRDGAYAESRAVPFGAPVAAETIAGLTVSTATL